MKKLAVILLALIVACTTAPNAGAKPKEFSCEPGVFDRTKNQVLKQYSERIPRYSERYDADVFVYAFDTVPNRRYAFGYAEDIKDACGLQWVSGAGYPRWPNHHVIVVFDTQGDFSVSARIITYPTLCFLGYNYSEFRQGMKSGRYGDSVVNAINKILSEDSVLTAVDWSAVYGGYGGPMPDPPC